MIITPVYIGFAAGIFTGVSMLPQLLKLWRDKDVKSLSVITILVLVAGLMLWVTYGILIGDLPIIITNGFSLLVNLLLLFTIIQYNKKSKNTF